MLGIFRSERSKTRSAAKHWIYLANKVRHFRRDELSEADLAALQSRLEALRRGLKAKPADTSRLRLDMEALEGHLKKVGGALYPRSSFGENVEFFLVALILYAGCTAFFLKPFKIPTNSMWPTYHGMTAEVYRSEEQKPNALAKWLRLIAFGAVRHEVEAPADGELSVPVLLGQEFAVPYDIAPKRRYLVLPGQGYRFTFEVGGEPVSFKTPLDFSIEEWVLGPALFPEAESFEAAVRRRIRSGAYEGTRRMRFRRGDGATGYADVIMVRTGRRFREGETMFSFDILTGDQLLVDRMSYHFVRPKLGDGFVFRTGAIPKLNGSDKFYIKRLAGTPGGRLQIADGALLIDGEPARGSPAFDRNASRELPYEGYLNKGLLAEGKTVEVPDRRYFALGDNSDNSQDSRYWGFVPDHAVVGQPVFIYYPFTRRFGLPE